MKNDEEPLEKDERKDENVLKKKKEIIQKQAIEETVNVIQQMVCLPLISKMMWTSHHRSLVTEFVKNQKERILCCNILGLPTTKGIGGPRLTVSLNFPLGNVGVVWYFVKISSKVELSRKNISSSLIYGMVQTEEPRSIHHFLINLFQSFVYQMEMDEFEDKPNDEMKPGLLPVCRRSKYTLHPYVMSQLDKLICVRRQIFLLSAELVHQVSLVLSDPDLYIPKDVELLCKYSTQMRTKLQISSITSDIEELLLSWVEEVQLFLFKFGYCDSPTEKGLLHEIQEIHKKATVINALIRITESPSATALQHYLTELASPFTIFFQKVKKKMKELLKMFSERCDFLRPLTEPLEKLYVDSVNAILDNVYDIIAILKILWTTSSQHRCCNLMEDYFVRLSWDIVRGCQYQIPLIDILSPPSSTPSQKISHPSVSSASQKTLSDAEKSPIEAILKFCQSWRNCYFQLFEHFRDENDLEDSSLGLWMPEPEPVFLPVDLFVSRCQDLKYIWQSKTQLTRYNAENECILTIRSAVSLTGCGGPEADMLEEDLSQVDIILRDALETVRAKARYVFDLASKEWLKHFDQYREKIEEIEQRYQCVMVSAVQIASSTSQGLEILNIFRPLAARKSLFAVFFIMMDHVLSMFEKTLDKIEKQHVFRSLRVGKPGFRFSEMAVWATATKKKLEQDINLIRTQHWLPFYPRFDVVYKRGFTLCEMLKQSLSKLYTMWIQTLNLNYKTKLRQPILRWQSGTVQILEPNFDKQLQMEMNETKAWEKLGFDIPDKLKEIHEQSDKLFALILKVKNSTTKFNSIIKRISKDETQLFEAHFKMMVKAFYPGITSLNWLKKNEVENLCENADEIVVGVHQEVDAYLQQNVLILHELENIKKLIFYDKKTHRVYEHSEFQEDILFQQNVIIDQVKISFSRIKNTLLSLEKKFVHEDLPKTKSAFIQYVTKVDDLLLDSLREILKRSFLSFEGLLVGSRCCPSSHLVPVFQIEVSMSGNSIVCSPPIDHIQETVTHFKEAFEVSFEGIPCLLHRFKRDKEQLHCHRSELDHPFCQMMQEKLTEEFALQSERLRDELKEYGQFKDLWEVNVGEFFRSYVKSEPDVESYRNDISSLDTKLYLLNDYDESSNCGIFLIDWSPLLTLLKKRCQIWIDNFLERLHKNYREKLQQIQEFIEITERMIDEIPESLEEVLEAKKEMILAKENVNNCGMIYSSVSDMFAVLKHYKYPHTKKESNEFEELKSQNLRLKGRIEAHIIKLNNQQDLHRKKYIIKAEEILQMIKQMKSSYRSHLPTKSDITLEKAIFYLEMVHQSLNKIKEKLSINTELQVLNLPLIDFPEMDTYGHHLNHLKDVWKLYAEWESDWEKVSNIVLWDIDSIDFQEMLQRYERRFQTLLSESRQHPSETMNGSESVRPTYEVEDDLLTKIESCKELLPLIMNFQNAHLNKHHWGKIKQTTKLNFDEKSPTFTLSKFQSLNLVLYQSEINQVFYDALEEVKLTEALENVKTKSYETLIHVKQIPNAGTLIVHAIKDTEEDVQSLAIRLNTIFASPYAKYYLSDIKENDVDLSLMTSLLQILSEFQKEWIRWNPFFCSSSVRNHLINISSIYDVINRKWQDILSSFHMNPYLRKIICKREIFTVLKDILDDIKKIGSFTQTFLLDCYFHYPRFCFLSFDDMINAVSKVKDGESAKPFLCKMFTNVERLKCVQNVKQNYSEIVGVFSEEGEFLELNPYVPVVGEFDGWLEKLEKSIETTLREDVRQCRLAVKVVGSKIDEIVKVWPLQVCVISYLIQWDVDIVKSFIKDKVIEGSIKKLMKKITDTAARINSVLQENIPKLYREKLQLFYLEVFKIRDQLDSLGKTPGNGIQYFSYRWDKESNNVTVHVTPYKFTYSWEYQGLWTPSVITPCYYQMAFKVATFLTRGLAIGIVGEKGSGKTEFVTSLSRSLGRNLKCVNLLESTNLLTLYLLLLGTYHTPTWLLFENTNAISADLLMSIEDIFINAKINTDFSLGKTASSSSPKLLNIDSVCVLQDPRSSVFFEFNDQNPDNLCKIEVLREICKPVVLVLPDLQMIVECQFVQNGLPNPEVNSRKLATLLKTCSSVFPAEMGHLFKLTSVKKIIEMMRLITTNKSNGVESVDIFPNVLKKYFLTQIESEYIPVLEEAFTTEFPDLDFAPPFDTLLENAIEQNLEEQGCLLDKSYVQEMLNLYDTIKLNKSVIIRGPPKCGKSRAIASLAKAVSKLSNDNSVNYKTIICEYICPQNMKLSTLYGTSLHLENLKARGYFPSLLKRLTTTALVENWVILKGFYSSSWISEILRRICGKYFIANNNQLIQIADNIKFIFDVTLEKEQELLVCDSTPIFFFNGQSLVWSDILSNGLKNQHDESLCAEIQRLLDLHLSKFIKTLGQTTVSNEEMIIKSLVFLAIIKYYLGKSLNKAFTFENQTSPLTPLIIFSLVWAYGTEASFAEIDHINDLTTRILGSLSSDASIFEVAIDKNTLQLCPWKDILRQNNPNIDEHNLESEKFTFLCEIIAESKIPVLITGPPGSGKSELLSRLKKKCTSQPFYISYDTTTTPICLNQTIMNTISKKTLGHATSSTFFIDNMECHEDNDKIFNTLAYIKYVSEHGQVFDEELKAFRKIYSIQWYCVYQSSSELKLNLKWHLLSKAFHVLVCSPFSKKSFKNLFKRLSNLYIRDIERDVKSMISVIEEALTHLYFKVKPKEILQALHHPVLIERFMKGFSIYNQEYLDRENFIRVFIHEFHRNFFDCGLVSAEEAKRLTSEILTNFFCLSESTVEEKHSLVYTQIGNKDFNYASTTILELYEKLKHIQTEFVDKAEKEVLLFPSFIKHLTNILRVTGMHGCSENIPEESSTCLGGNLLLIGPEGSGKKTCIRLATMISNWNLVEIEGTESDKNYIHDSLKLRENDPTAILIDWVCLKDVRNVSFLNDILATGGSEEKKSKVCLMICISKLSQIAMIRLYIPAFFALYTTDSFSVWDRDDLEIITAAMFKRASDLENFIGSSKNIFATTYYIHKSFSTTDFPSSKYLVFINTFFKFAKTKHTEYTEKKKWFQLNIEKFNETQQLVQELSHQLKKQHTQVTQIQQTCGNTVLKMRNIKSEQGRLEQELTKKTSLLNRQREESQRIKELIDRDLNDPRKEIDAIYRDITRITKEDFEVLKKVLRPLPEVETIFTIVMVIINLEPTWNEVKKQLSNSLELITKIREISIEDVPDKIVSYIEENLPTNLDVNPSTTNIPLPALYFYRWIKTFMRYIKIYRDYHPLKIQANTIEKDMEETQSTIKSYQYDLANFSVQHTVLFDQLKEREKSMETAEDKMKTLENKIQLAESVMEQLNQEKNTWEQSVIELNNRISEITGNSLIMAATVAYLGYFEYKERSEYLLKWKTEIRENKIKFSDHNIVEMLISIDSKVKWQENGLKMDDVSLEGMAIITESPLSQIIFDPHDILKSFFDANEEYNEIKIQADGYEELLYRCITQGKKCLIRVQHSKLPYIVEKLIRSLSQSDSGTCQMYSLIIDGVTHDVKFPSQILVVISSPREDTELGFVANVIDLSRDETMLQKLIAFHLFEKYCKETVDAQIRAQRESVERIHQIRQCELNIQELMTRFDEALSEGSNLIESLQITCTKVSEMRQKYLNTIESIKLTEKTLTSYELTATQLTNLFSLVNRLNYADASVVIGFQRFLALVVDEVIPRRVVQHTWGTLLEANILLLAAQGVYRHFQQQISGFTLVAVGLLLVTWYESTLESCHHNILNVFYVHDCHAPEGSVRKNIMNAWMEDDRWFSLVFFTENSPFPDLLNHLEINPKLWYEWCSSEQPENMALPRTMEKNIKGLSRLALVKCLRPDRFIEAANILIERKLRQPKKTTNATATVIALASSGHPYEPIIIRSFLPIPVENVLKRSLPICHPVLAADSKGINIVSLGAGREDYIKSVISSCVQKGHWLLLKCKRNLKKYITLIESEMEQVKHMGANRRFKLWIYDLSDDYISNRFYQSCQIIYLTQPDLLKECIEHLYEITGENRISCYVNNVMKLHLLCLALMHIAIETRQSFPGDIVGVSQQVSELQWSEAEAVLLDFMSGSYYEGFALKDIVTPFYAASSLTESSYKVIQATVESYLAPATILNISERIKALRHYSVPYTNDIASHLTQLEFVYKAPSSVVTNVSQSLYNNQQTIYCKKVENILSKVLGKSTLSISFSNQLTALHDLKDTLNTYNPKCNSVLYLYLQNEKSFLIRSICAVLRVENSSDEMLMELKKFWPDSVGEGDILCQNCLLKRKLSSLVERAEYLLTIKSMQSLENELILGNLREPICFWSFMMRKMFDSNCEEVVSASLTSEAGFQDDASNEGTSEVMLQNLYLVGSLWDSTQKTLHLEENPSLSAFFTKLHLAVMPVTEGVRKFIEKSDKGKN